MVVSLGVPIFRVFMVLHGPLDFLICIIHIYVFKILSSTIIVHAL